MQKVSLVLAGVLVSAASFAGKPDPKSISGMAIVKRDADSYKLIYKSEEASDVRVEIFNGKNERVFAEVIKKSNGFVRPYNFASLSEGEYTIKIDNGSNWLTETVDYHALKPGKLAQVVQLENGKFLLTVGGHGEDRLAIRIFDEQGLALHEDDQPVYGDFAQVYDFGALQGPFSFEVTDKSGASRTVRR